jgi:3-oxosteroid 1-dehydrogenase
MAKLGRFDHETDVVVVGSGGAGMVCALVVDEANLDVLIIEKNAYFGGSTARSGGGLWAPNSPATVRGGLIDSPEEVVEYLDRIVGDRVDRGRVRRYVDEVPQMMRWLEQLSPHLRDAFIWIRGYPDYHPDRGGHPLGRGVWAKPIDKRLLGEEINRLHPGVKRMSLPLGAWITSVDLRKLLAVRWGGLRKKRILVTLAWRILRARLLGERIGVSGQALATRLRLAIRDAGIPLWLETPMQSLIVDEAGTVVGVEAERGGRPFRIHARVAVFLASGGADHNLELRRRHQPGIDQDWSLGSPGNTGDGILAGQSVGAAVELMDEAWWHPVMRLPDGSPVGVVPERQYPGQFIVNAAGRRFVNEASPYGNFVRAQLDGHATGVSHIPAWMIIDHRAWRRNIICGHFPGSPMPRSWVEAGLVHRADSISELATKIGVPPDALEATWARFNELARRGVDEDFHRGESAYDRYYADPTYPNPNLCPVDRSPFYAFSLFPGDLGTKGGLVTDANARVLRDDGTAIEALYASGNVTASVMGVEYAGPGATLGPALTFAFVAGKQIARSADRASRDNAESASEQASG